MPTREEALFRNCIGKVYGNSFRLCYDAVFVLIGEVVFCYFKKLDVRDKFLASLFGITVIDLITILSSNHFALCIIVFFSALANLTFSVVHDQVRTH